MREQRRVGLISVGYLLAVGAFSAGCADGPTAVGEEATGAVKPQATTTDEQPPPDPRIYWASTSVGFYGGEWGGGPQAEVLARTEYLGNRVSHDVDFTATSDDGQAIPGRTAHETASTWYDVSFRKDFATHFFAQLPKNCGLSLQANTTHDVWWEIPNPLPNWPNWTTGHAIQLTGGSASAPACASPPACPPPPPDNPPMEQTAPMRPQLTCGDPGGGWGGGGGYWITVTTCWGYHLYVNGIYQYSVIEGCDSYSYFVAEE